MDRPARPVTLSAAALGGPATTEPFAGPTVAFFAGAPDAHAAAADEELNRVGTSHSSLAERSGPRSCRRRDGSEGRRPATQLARTIASTDAAAGLSPFHFLRVSREVLGVTPHPFRKAAGAAARLQ
jgi:hypothetical protein